MQIGRGANAACLRSFSNLSSGSRADYKSLKAHGRRTGGQSTAFGMFFDAKQPLSKQGLLWFRESGSSGLPHQALPIGWP